MTLARSQSTITLLSVRSPCLGMSTLLPLRVVVDPYGVTQPGRRRHDHPPILDPSWDVHLGDDGSDPASREMLGLAAQYDRRP
jgi:hypothetical protein